MPPEASVTVLRKGLQSLLSKVLDTLIPPDADRGLPGAGELGLAEEICERAGDFLPVLEPALDALGEVLRAGSVPDFASLEDAEQRSLLEELAVEHPAFLPGLSFQAFSKYYQHPRVLRGLGLDARPPFPRGHDLEAGDPDLLEPVRRRGPIYRDC